MGYLPWAQSGISLKAARGVSDPRKGDGRLKMQIPATPKLIAWMKRASKRVFAEVIDRTVIGK